MPYKIALLSKYPPLEGGIAAKTYWLARGLSERGHAIHVITHGISAGREYRIQGSENPPDRMPNVWVHRSPDEIPWHIPEDNEHALALLDITVRVIREYKIQILDTGYFVPYGILGHLAKISTGVFHVMRHGGSDLEKFLKGKLLGLLLNEAIASADTVITQKGTEDMLKPITSHLVYHPAYIPDDKAFTPSDAEWPQWRLATIGKINYHWQHKALHLIAEIMGQLVPSFECWIVGQGKGLVDFQQSLNCKNSPSFKWCPFVPPWEMPHLLRQLDAIFVFESKLPHPVVSNLVLEAVCSKVGIITDRGDFAETYRDILTLDKNQVLLISPTEASSSAEMIAQWIQERARTKQIPRQLISYQDYLSSTEKIYDEVLCAETR